MKLTSLQVKNVKYEGKDRKIFDGKGLYLHVTRSGKYWRYKYSFAKREKKLCIGVYPDITLKVARDMHEDARTLLRKGICPCAEKQRHKQELKQQNSNTFSKIAFEWYEFNLPKWKSKKTAQRAINTLKTYAFPYIGETVMTNISPMEMIKLKRVGD